MLNVDPSRPRDISPLLKGPIFMIKTGASFSVNRRIKWFSCCSIDVPEPLSLIPYLSSRHIALVEVTLSSLINIDVSSNLDFWRFVFTSRLKILGSENLRVFFRPHLLYLDIDGSPLSVAHSIVRIVHSHSLYYHSHSLYTV